MRTAIWRHEALQYDCSEPRNEACGELSTCLLFREREWIKKMPAWSKFVCWVAPAGGGALLGHTSSLTLTSTSRWAKSSSVVKEIVSVCNGYKKYSGS
jgi:hypothetical protein